MESTRATPALSPAYKRRKALVPLIVFKKIFQLFFHELNASTEQSGLAVTRKTSSLERTILAKIFRQKESSVTSMTLTASISLKVVKRFKK